MAAFRATALLGSLGIVGFGLWSRDGISDARWLALLGASWLLLIAALWPRLPRSVPSFNRSVIRTAVILVSVFAILSAQLARIQVVRSDAIVDRVATAPNGEVIANPRLQAADLRVKRGRVYDRNGVLVADTVRSGDIWRRVYPEPESAYVVGYYSPLLYGESGLEASYDAELTGSAGNNAALRWLNDLLHRPQEGLDLYLTLDAELQRTAHDLLDGRAGSVVLLDVKTGEVLTLASNPNYDPNQLFTTSPAERDDAASYWAELVEDPSSPLLPRATQGLFTPGSTFKTVTACAAIDAGFSSPEQTYEDNGELNVDGHIIVEQNRPDDSIDTWTLEEALAWSLNVVYAQVGLALGPDLMIEYAERFGFGETVPFDLPVAASQLASSPDFLDSDPALADTAFGQGEILATPLLMAMIAAAIANGGAMMEPFLVDHLGEQDGDTVRTTDPDVWRSPVSQETAAQVRDMMIYAVETGYAQGAQIEGLTVGGKTGTAETGDGDPHAWFIGFAGDPDPQYAVAVVLEHGGGGLAGALTIGRDMLAAVMATR